MNSVNETIKKAKGTISRHSMTKKGDLIAVAVSGGPDSVCLLDILYQLRDDLGIELMVVHFNHGLRPAEDEKETMFVESVASSLNLFFETGEANASIRNGKGSLEEKARHARYLFFDEVKKGFSAQKIAVGHNLNDQAETVLMRLLRGSGSAGLAGIRPYRDDGVIRPLIEITRDEIASYLKVKKLGYMTDASNFNTHHLRNRIRIELLPLLKEYQPRIVEILGQTAEIMRGDDRCMEAVADKWVEDNTETRGETELHIPVPSLIKLPEAMRNRVIRLVLRMTGGTLRAVSLRHIKAITRIAMGDRAQSEVNLPDGITVKKVYDKMVFTLREEISPGRFYYSLNRPGSFHMEGLRCTLSVEEIDREVLPEDLKGSPWIIFLDADQISYPLTIRTFQAGDKFIPFGMSGHKKLKDFFIDLKIPSKDRTHIPILTCKDIPIWVCGLRLDDRFKVTPVTRRVLKVTMNKWTECV